MNKKGAAWISYILATMFFVLLAVMVVLWGRGTTTESAERAVTFVSGRLDCQSIRIDAKIEFDIDGNCVGVNITNKGSLNILKVLVRYGEGDQVYSDPVLVSNPPQTVSVVAPNAPDTKYTLLPVLEVEEELVGCQDKTLNLNCPSP